MTNNNVIVRWWGLSDYMKDGRVFSEYRVRDAINAQDVEAAVGLRKSIFK